MESHGVGCGCRRGSRERARCRLSGSGANNTAGADSLVTATTPPHCAMTAAAPQDPVAAPCVPTGRSDITSNILDAPTRNVGAHRLRPTTASHSNTDGIKVSA